MYHHLDNGEAEFSTPEIVPDQHTTINNKSQDWNSLPQHRINQNQHQVDEGHHTRHHKELALN